MCAFSPFALLLRSMGARAPVKPFGQGSMKENTAKEQVGSGADRLESFLTRRGFVKVSGAFVAGMVALGLLPDSAAAAPTSSKGEVDYYATPAHVLKVNRARCTGCQRCEMMCTLKNDGASQPAAARIHVHDGLQLIVPAAPVASAAR